MASSASSSRENLRLCNAKLRNNRFVKNELDNNNQLRWVVEVVVEVVVAVVVVMVVVGGVVAGGGVGGGSGLMVANLLSK